MTTNFDNAVPIVKQPFLYINGMVISNDATTPNTVLDISAGICRDSTNSFDINLGNYLGMANGQAANSTTTINAGATGINGLDTGTLSASTVYYVYVVGDAVSANTTGCMISKALPSVGPLMPYGYNVFRNIGYVVTDSSSHFLLFYQSGNNNSRTFTFDAPITAVTGGNATTYTSLDLSAFVPNVNNLVLSVSYSFTPGAASRTLSMQGANSTGDAVVITGQVTSVVMSGLTQVLAQTKSAKPQINYKVANSGDAATLKIAGFNYTV